MATDAEIESDVVAQLAATDRYACSSITRLNGGTANFVYRGVLTSTLEEDRADVDNKDIIIKHTKDFVALNRAFKLDAERCVSNLSIYLLVVFLQFARSLKRRF